MLQKELPSNYGRALLPVLPAPASSTSVDGGAVPLPKHDVPNVLATFAPPNLAGVASARVNYAAGYGIGHTADDEAEEAPQTAMPRRNFPCTHCPAVELCDKQHKTTCPYWLWQNEEGVSQPSRAKDETGKVPME